MTLFRIILALGLVSTFLFRPSPLIPCPDPHSADPRTHPQCFFSETYVQARALFTHFATQAGARLVSLKISEGLSVDIAVLEGEDSSDVVLHFSGTHGVEGFVGSAIQSGSLSLMKKSETRKKTVIFVHSLNPYGMANYRRVNENNVDLNRNALFSDSEREASLRRDPNIAGYEDINHVLNPSRVPSLWSSGVLVLDTASTIMNIGMTRFKRAMVTGTYTNELGMFFGGKSLQPSHHSVAEFLRQEHFLDNTRKLTLIDVHSGLGPYGQDTLMFSDGKKEDYVKAFGQKMEAQAGHVLRDYPWIGPYAVEMQGLAVGAGNEASEGYDLTVGDLQANYPKLFKNLQDMPFSVTQEFGTFAPHWVAWQLAQENQAAHFGTAEHKVTEGAKLKQTFSPSQQSFAEKVMPRGLFAFFKSLEV